MVALYFRWCGISLVNCFLGGPKRSQRGGSAGVPWFPHSLQRRPFGGWGAARSSGSRMRVSVCGFSFSHSLGGPPVWAPTLPRAFGKSIGILMDNTSVLCLVHFDLLQFDACEWPSSQLPNAAKWFCLRDGENDNSERESDN